MNPLHLTKKPYHILLLHYQLCHNFYPSNSRIILLSKIIIFTDQKRSSSKSPEMVSSHQGGYSTNFGAGLKGGGSRGVEGQIMTAIFKTLVSRLVKSLKELKTQENVVSYSFFQRLES